MIYSQVLAKFASLTEEQKQEIDNIFNEHYSATRPKTRFDALAHIAAYVITRQKAEESDLTVEDVLNVVGGV
ncbi:hypothetical protein CTP45_24610 [Salmonella enterica]|uniref:Uncharacterized protein n=1 Tax=Salmonella enterica subsp. enterica serovar Saintpaul TaxID=90105 RepID=A0A5U9I8C7_SALET|nr:hypothetical protein [Salmonella enterica]EBS2301364.1 hypothetical protein [Salmonella enterica subsp. enterica serovar Saintpaul]EDW0017498.1 hypothetical protein [Salmonella enterica subsp. enterica serovar Aba]HCZ4727710.1 hypothetical protein [Salmonella enterica subsp. enterica serovar Saintpaul str. CFSAN004137]EAW8023121.1 hypothetical protein [Salmonella enterica]